MSSRARAQSSVELLIVLAVSLTILAVLINFTSDQLGSLQKDNAIRLAQQSMQTLIQAINRTYAQGPGTVALVEVKWPPGIVSNTATITGRSIVMRVYDTDVAGTAVPLLTGSLSTTTGTQLVRIVAYDSNVQLGSNMLSANLSSVYVPMAQDSNQTSRVTLTNNSSDTVSIAMSLPWSYSQVGASLSPTSGSIPGGGTLAFNLSASALAGALGNYVGLISVSGTYPSSTEALAIPVNIEVYPNANSLLTAVPDALSFQNYSTDSNTLSFELCNTSNSPITTISFTPSSGNAGDWVQGISTIPSLAAGSCTTVDVTVTPSSGIPGEYSGSLLVKDYTGANSVVLPLTVDVVGQSSVFTWDWTDATLEEDLISGFVLGNTGDQSITLDKITISNWWACDSSHATMTGIMLNGNLVYSGTLNDGNVADIDDTSIDPDSTIGGSKLYFNPTINDEGEQFVATVQFSDGSTYTSPTFGNGCSADVTPPARVTSLVASAGPTPASVQLSWTYSGDDNFSGTPVRAVLRYAKAYIYGDYVGDSSYFKNATDYPLTTMQAGGTTGTLTIPNLDMGYTYAFWLVFYDEADQNGGVSPVSLGRPLNKMRYALSQFPNTHFVWSLSNSTGDFYAGDVNQFAISNFVTSGGSVDRNVALAVYSDSRSAWIAYLIYSPSRLRNIYIYYPHDISDPNIFSSVPQFDGNYNLAIGTLNLDDNSVITGGWQYGGSQVNIGSATTISILGVHGFSDFNIAGDQGPTLVVPA